MCKCLFIFRMDGFSLNLNGSTERNNHCSINCAVFFTFFSLAAAAHFLTACPSNKTLFMGNNYTSNPSPNLFALSLRETYHNDWELEISF